MDEVLSVTPHKAATGFRLIFGYLFYFMAFAGFLMLLPLSMLAFYPSEYACYLSFLVPGLTCAVIGITGAAVLLSKKEKGRLGKHQDSVLLVGIWLLVILAGAFPFYLAGKFAPGVEAAQVTFSEAFFESMSGFSATGFAVTQNYVNTVDAYCPHVFQFYRSLTQFIGGVGLVLVVSSAVSDRHGLKLFYTEGHNDRLLPNLAKTARLIFGLYIAIIVIGSFGLWLFGIPFFDAACLSISSMATGGFTPVEGGFTFYASAYFAGNGVLPYNSIGAEIVCCFLMLAGATSFLLIYHAFTFKWKRFIRDSEICFAAIFLVVAILLGAGLITYQFSDGIRDGVSFWDGIRYSGFQMISCITTTGLANVPDIAILGKGAIFISIVCMIIGGGVGSTAGAIKQQRIVIIFKNLWWSIKYRLSPYREIRPHIIYRGGKKFEASDAAFQEASHYAALYILVLLFLTLALMFLPGLSITDSFYFSASGLSGTGNSIVDLLAYKGAHELFQYHWLLWILSLSMLLGRLEILPIYYGAMRIGKDLFRKETV